MLKQISTMVFFTLIFMLAAALFAGKLYDPNFAFLANVIFVTLLVLELAARKRIGK